MIWIPLVIVVGLAGLYILLHMLNSRVKEPAGCEERRKEFCDVCQLANSCKAKKEEE